MQIYASLLEQVKGPFTEKNPADFALCLQPASKTLCFSSLLKPVWKEATDTWLGVFLTLERQLALCDITHGWLIELF